MSAFEDGETVEQDPAAEFLAKEQVTCHSSIVCPLWLANDLVIGRVKAEDGPQWVNVMYWLVLQCIAMQEQLGDIGEDLGLAQPSPAEPDYTSQPADDVRRENII